MPDKFDEEQKVNEVIEKLTPSDDLSEVGKLRSTASGMYNLSLLHCYGCSHSSAEAKFPGKPSGERPCFFCVRNPDRESWQADHKKQVGYELKEWYNGSPIAFYPIDCYLTIDMNEQIDRWEKRARGDPDWNIPQGGLKFG